MEIVAHSGFGFCWQKEIEIFEKNKIRN